jgi:hypothetical protein
MRYIIVLLVSLSFSTYASEFEQKARISEPKKLLFRESSDPIPLIDFYMNYFPQVLLQLSEAYVGEQDGYNLQSRLTIPPRVGMDRQRVEWVSLKGGKEIAVLKTGPQLELLKYVAVPPYCLQ